MKFIIKASLASDVWNWQEVAVHKGSYGQDWRANWPKDLTLKDARDKKKMRAYLVKRFYRCGAVQKYVEWLQVALDPKRIDKILLEITGKRVPFKELLVTPTTNGRCPYDPGKGSFFIHYAAAPKWIYRTATHECMHLIIHKYYWKQMRDAGLSDQQAHDIKESLTVLLNPVFEARWGGPENGYPNHRNLRKDIARIAKTTKNFDEIMTKTIKLFQKKYYHKVS
jgi:hypothetical protein